MSTEQRNLWAVVGVEGRDQGPETGASHAFTRFRQQYGDPERSVTDTIARTVFYILCRRYHVDPELIRSAARTASLVYVRQLYCYVMETVYNPTVSFQQQVSLSAIGRVLGDRDHTTAIHSIRGYVQRLASNEPLPKGLHSTAEDTVTDYERALDSIARYCVATR